MSEEWRTINSLLITYHSSFLLNHSSSPALKLHAEYAPGSEEDDQNRDRNQGRVDRRQQQEHD
jgi:hypothetical protein